MRGKYLKGKTIQYDGSQLRPLWSYTNADLPGDSIVAFRGPCNVGKEYLVNVEDEKKNSMLSSPDMLHFLVEYFNCDIRMTILLQRLLLAVVVETIRDSGIYEEVELEREYNTIFAYLSEEGERRRLSFSDSTVSPLSGLIHMGLNVKGEDASVSAGLVDIGVEEIDVFAVEVLKRYIEEIREVRIEACRVRPVV